MEQFRFYQPTRIHFGAGCLNQVGSIVGKYGKKCMLVTTTNTEDVLRPLYDRVKALLSEAGIQVVHFDKVVPNPTISGIEEAIALVHQEKVEVVLAVGGGSSIDTAKSITLFNGAGKVDWPKVFSTYTDPFAEYESPSPEVLPLVAVPTTAGTGSELTQAMVISDPEHNDKECIFHDKAFAKEAIIDPELMRTLPPRMTAITGFDEYARVLEGLEASLAAGLKTKLNCVLLPGCEGRVLTLARFAQDRPVDVRFIEVMPIGEGARTPGPDREAVLHILKERWPDLHPVEEIRGNGPAHYYAAEGLTGRIGLIDAVSHKFCERCNRVRLTSTGLLKPCLCYGEGTDLRALLRGGKNDLDTLTEALRQTIWNKPRAHCFDDAAAITEQKKMSEIGG